MTTRALQRAKIRDRVRQKVYDRSGGQCERQRRRDCIRGVLPFAGRGLQDHGYLVHELPPALGGKTDEKNCKWSCWRCALLPAHGRPMPTDTTRPNWTADYYGN